MPLLLRLFIDLSVRRPGSKRSVAFVWSFFSLLSSVFLFCRSQIGQLVNQIFLRLVDRVAVLVIANYPAVVFLLLAAAALAHQVLQRRSWSLLSAVNAVADIGPLLPDGRSDTGCGNGFTSRAAQIGSSRRIHDAACRGINMGLEVRRIDVDMCVAMTDMSLEVRASHI